MADRVTRIQSYSCPNVGQSVNVKIELSSLRDGQGKVVATHTSMKGCDFAHACGVATKLNERQMTFDWAKCAFKQS